MQTLQRGYTHNEEEKVGVCKIQGFLEVLSKQANSNKFIYRIITKSKQQVFVTTDILEMLSMQVVNRNTD